MTRTKASASIQARNTLMRCPFSGSSRVSTAEPMVADALMVLPQPLRLELWPGIFYSLQNGGYCANAGGESRHQSRRKLASNRTLLDRGNGRWRSESRCAYPAAPDRRG